MTPLSEPFIDKAVGDLAAFMRSLLEQADDHLRREPVLRHCEPRDEPFQPFAQQGEPSVLFAERIYQMRRRRAALFSDPGLFGEAAYDIMLDLYIATKRHRRVSISSSCIAADVPSTTALRHIRVLEARGFVTRRSDPEDRRRSFLELTPRAMAALEAHLVV